MDSTWMTTAVAVGGTLLGSGLTALVAARTERRKDESLRRQQLRQEAVDDRTRRRDLRVEHRKWRRDSRQAAYQNLMDAAHEAHGAIWQLARLTSDPYDRPRYDTRRGIAIDAVRATRQAAHRVQLEGPTPVAQAALDWAEAVDRHIHPPVEYLRELGEGPLSDERKDRYRSAAAETGLLVEAMRRRFVPLAREALDEVMGEAADDTTAGPAAPGVPAGDRAARTSGMRNSEM
ncbi:hypothetical protein AB0I93_17770 [Streptomyces sp. NPDC049967]|uniref:hypothetical protein n=1 Tax=Streptomyces sp. NPDC049967 TaxID=3155658 RepID=UPI00343B6D46